MKIDVTTRALIPTRLIAEAAQESSRRALGRIQPHAQDIRVTVTDRRLKPGVACCEVEIDLADGTAVMARSINANPVEAVSKAFEKVARTVSRRLRQQWTRRRAAQLREMVVLRPHDTQTGITL